MSQQPRKIERPHSPEGKLKRSSLEEEKKVTIDLVSSTKLDISILELKLELAKKQKVLKQAKGALADKDEIMCLGMTGFSLAEGMFDSSDEGEGGGDEGEGEDALSDGSDVQVSQIESRRR